MQLTSTLTTIISPEEDAETTFRLLVALANLISQNEDCKELAADFGIYDTIAEIPKSGKAGQLAAELISKYHKP